MKNLFIKIILLSMICVQFNVCGRCQDSPDNGQSILFELNWGKGQNEVSLISKESDDPLAGSGPVDISVDEKNKLIYIGDGMRLLQCDYQGNTKKIINRKMSDGSLALQFNVDIQGNLYIHNRSQKGDHRILIFNSGESIIKTITLKSKAYMQELYVDNEGFIWAGVYFDESFKINSNGEVIARFGKDKTGIARSKGKYFVKSIPRDKNDNSRIPKDQYLCDSRGNTITRLPASAVIVGTDKNSNCYLNVWVPFEEKQYIWVVNSFGKTIARHELNCKLHDQDNFLQIFVAESGNIYIAPNSDLNHKFKIIKIRGLD
jgi:hypothetical protein